MLGIPRGISSYADHLLKDYELKVVALHLELLEQAVEDLLQQMDEAEKNIKAAVAEETQQDLADLAAMTKAAGGYGAKTFGTVNFTSDSANGGLDGIDYANNFGPMGLARNNTFIQAHGATFSSQGAAASDGGTANEDLGPLGPRPGIHCDCALAHKSGGTSPQPLTWASGLAFLGLAVVRRVRRSRRRC